MVRKTTILFVTLAVTGWATVFMLWMDNRFLAGMAKARSESEWVRPGSINKLADACETLSDVNKRDQALLYYAKQEMEKIDVIRQINKDRLTQPPKGRRHDQVRRVARRPVERGDAGSGGVGGRTAAD